MFRNLLDKLNSIFHKTPYKRVMVIIELNDNDAIIKELFEKNVKKSKVKTDYLDTIKIPAINNAMFMLNTGDYIILDNTDDLDRDSIHFIDYETFNLPSWSDDKNTLNVVGKNYIYNYGKIIFIVVNKIIYNNNINIVLKLINPADENKNIGEIAKENSKYVTYAFSTN